MSRRTRTLEILTAANLLPQQLAVEQARGARDARVAQALASLVPATISVGTGALGKLADYQAEPELLALKRDDLTVKSATDKAAAAAATARAEAMKVKAEADKVKATADAAEATRKADNEMGKTTSEQSMAALRAAAGAPQANLQTLIGRASTDPGLGNLDDTAVAGILAEEQAKARKEAAAAGLAERKATAPLGPKPKSPEEVERQRKRDELLDEQLKQLRGKPEAAAQAADKLSTAQAEDVANIVGARRALTRISAEAKKTDPNILKSLWNSAISTVGVDGPLTGYVAEVRNFNSAVGAMRSGASIGVAEQKRLDDFLVSPGDTVGSVEAKRAAFEQYLNDKEAGLNVVRDIQGQAPIRIQTTPRPAGAAKPASEMTEEEIMAELDGGG